jgi:hypothetical protein
MCAAHITPEHLKDGHQPACGLPDTITLLVMA